MSDQRITDLSYFEELGMGDDELLVEMLEMFLKNTPESLKLLRQYRENGEWKKLGEEAHKLKPNLSYVGLDQAHELIVQIEKSAKNNPDGDAIRELIDQIDSICQEAYRELEEKLNELKN